MIEKVLPSNCLECVHYKTCRTYHGSPICVKKRKKIKKGDKS